MCWFIVKNRGPKPPTPRSWRSPPKKNELPLFFEMTDFYFLKIQRGKDLLIFDGFIFNKDKETVKKTTWRCKNRLCSGQIVIDFWERILRTKEHSHAKMTEKKKQIKFRNNSKNASKRVSSYHNIITNETRKLTEDEKKKKLLKTSLWEI